MEECVCPRFGIVLYTDTTLCIVVIINYTTNKYIKPHKNVVSFDSVNKSSRAQNSLELQVTVHCNAFKQLNGCSQNI